MEQLFRFEKGLQQDTDYQLQPEGSYRSAENWLVTPALHLLAERSASLLAVIGRPVVGATALGNQEILFSTSGTYSEIGVLDGSIYTVILGSTEFKLGSIVRATARLDYRNHRLVYWADGSSLCWLDLDEPTTVIPQGLQLLAAPTLPVVTPVAVTADGQLSTGVYQFAATLLSGSKNDTGYGLFSGVVPILNEDPTTTARQLLDGAPPQTVASGSITVQLDNLDTSYSYVQLVVATYVGLDNTLELHKLAPISLNGRSSVTFTYYSDAQHEEQTTLVETLSQLPQYVSAAEITQKDGHLLAGGVKVVNASTVDWQSIANGIVLGPAIKEVPFSETVTITHYVEGNSSSQDVAPLSYNKEDYKNPLLTATAKGLQRGEVYSFCFIPIVNGRYLDAYHIPGCITQLSDIFVPYTSQELYPSNAGYPLGPIRHHTMPDISQQPLLGAGTIRILGVKEIAKPDFSKLSTSDLSQLTGYVIGMQARDTSNRSILAQGILNPLALPYDNYAYFVGPFSGKDSFKVDGGSVAAYSSLSREYAAFYSAETSITQNTVDTATSLRKVASLSGTSYGVADKRTGGLGEEFAAVFLDYTSVEPEPGSPVGLQLPATSTVQPQTGTGPFIQGELHPISTSGQNGFTLLKADLTSNGAGFLEQSSTADLKFQYNDKSTSNLVFRQADGSYRNGDEASWKGVTTRKLYNLERRLARQYGTLEQATYFPVFSSTSAAAPGSFFNGDTFIGKVSLLSATQEYQDKEPGIGYLTMSYFFCESMVNVNYRHYQGASNTSLGTLPYYPKSRLLWDKSGTGVMQYPTGLGQANGYNKQYSFTNRLNPFSAKDRTITEVTDFSNRIIYSVQGVEGEQLDAYRIFRANDYQDLPKNYGPITVLPQVGNTLYAHTTDMLWHLSFNERVTQESSLGEVVLGNGGLFPRPAEPITPVEGGMAGCQHPQAAIVSPDGYFFPDAKRGRVFCLGSGLEQISLKGLRSYFMDTLPVGSSYKACYDHENERYVLSGTDFQTISYSLYTKQWASFHSVSAQYVFSTGRRSLQFDNGNAYLANRELAFPAAIEVITNQSPLQDKLFNAYTIQANYVASTVRHRTSQQLTDRVNIVPYEYYGQDPQNGEVLYRQLNDQYQVAAVRDIEEGRLHGKWQSSNWRWAVTELPTLLRLLTSTFQARFR